MRLFLKMMIMSSIFCLETEWEQSVHDMKRDSSARPLLEYLKSLGTEFVFRQVATLSDFRYYLEHLSRPTYNRFDTVYLCFHGCEGKIVFANKESISLSEISENYPGIFSDKKVHFGSCSTLKVSDGIIDGFKIATQAKLVTGYAKPVGFHDSFLFELWLLYLLTNHKSLGVLKLHSKVEKEMKHYGNRLKFRIY